MPRTVLIVDDVKANREILKKILGDEYGYLEAENGEDAMRVLLRNYKYISAVLLDLAMPIMDGYEVMKQVRVNAALTQIPVIIMTSSTDVESEVKALAMGAGDYIAKPYNATIVRQRLRNMINLRETSATVNAMQRDRLTGLFNREAFFDRMGQEIQKHPAGYYILACFNIDSFSVINDQYGVDTGDEVLKHVANCMKQFTNDVGGLCSRIMADNFALLFPAEFSDTKRIHDAHKHIMSPDIIGRPISIRIGRFKIDDFSITPNAMYDRASIAERSIKGRFDKYIAEYDEAMRDKIMREQEIISEMDAALKSEQFEVWYQPQFNHSTGALIGAEALVRWHHPKKGIISPSEFIPIFEQNGFIYELDKFVWENVCRFLRKLIDEDFQPMPVSVNISRYDIFRDDFFDFITALVKNYDISTELLRLEITESAFTKSSEQIVGVTNKLIDYGFTIEIDDFGSGYSSLNTLKSVSAQVVKLDMRFLHADNDSTRGGNILESVVRMTKWLNMSVIAEGVETIEQADFLKSIGCVYVQGYLYAKPVHVDEYEKMLMNVEKEERLLRVETVENLDNNAFWNPNSIDTLIFNSYVGAACIFEYHEGAVELIRATDRYVEMLDCGLNIDELLKLDFKKCLDEDSHKRLSSALELSISNKNEVTGDYRFNLPNRPTGTYLRSTMRVIAVTGKRYLVYSTNENITAQVELEIKERRVSEQLQAIMDDMDGGISATTYNDNNFIFLFANDKYYEMLGLTSEEYIKEISDPMVLVHPEDREFVLHSSIESYEKGTSTQMEYRVIHKDGSIHWIRTFLSMTCFTGVNAKVQLCVYTDITAEKQAAQELKSTDEQLRFLNDAAHDILAQPDCDKGIESVLQKLLEYFDGNRAYIFELNHDRKIAVNTYEICAENIRPEKDNLQNLPFEVCQFWLHAFDNKGYVDVSNIESLDESRRLERETLQAQGIESLIAVPLKKEGVLTGFIGIDDPSRHNSRVDRLIAIGDYVAVLLARRDMEAKIISDSKMMARLMDDTPGGFVRLRMTKDGKLVPVYFNAGFCKLVDMTYDELMDMYENDAYAGVYPDDIDSVQETIVHMIEKGEASSSKYRLRSGKEEYISVMIFGRATNDEEGNTYLNIYYTDATEQNRREEQQKELLDNLPYGAALYEYDGNKGLSVVHLNKRYWELIGFSQATRDPNNFIDKIHPNDRAVMWEGLNDAIENNHDVVVDLRILDVHGNYRNFHIVGRIVKTNEKYSIYATFTLITDNVLIYRDMLPVVLSAIMNSTSDLAFAKDGNFRYICASRAFANLVGKTDENEIIGKTDYDLFSKELADKYRSDDEKLFTDGESIVDIVEVIPSNDDVQHFANTSKYLLQDADGNVIGLYGTGRDITAFRDTENKFQLLTDSIHGGLATYACTKDNARIINYNDTFCNLLGYDRKELDDLLAKDAIFMVHPEDRPIISKQLKILLKDGTFMRHTFRVRNKSGVYRWVSMRCALSERHGETVVVNAVFFDMTEQMEITERLRMSEEEYRLAMQHSGKLICRFNIAERTVTMTSESAALFGMPEKVVDVPYGPIAAGEVSEDTALEYANFYQQIVIGEKSGAATFRRKINRGWIWVEAHFSTLFSEAGEPVSAVISYTDVTEQREKETIYRRWQQSLQNKDHDSYTLFRCNLSKGDSNTTREGSLLYVVFDDSDSCFDDRTAEYVSQCVYDDDKKRYAAALDADSLLAGYYRGKRSDVIEYREKMPDGSIRWLQLSIDLVEYPNSNDVEVYLMYENIDEKKQAELQTKVLAEIDPLTGVLNRVVFADKMNALIKKQKRSDLNALLLLDLDGFKLVNDSYGHAKGDEALVEVANTISSIMRTDDLVGRLGGDEFIICLCNMKSKTSIAKKAGQICEALRKSFSIEVAISASIGIAVSPADGENFESLYHKADIALYHVKTVGKDNYAFFDDFMEDEKPNVELPIAVNPTKEHSKLKRRMLIVEDNKIVSELLVNMFKNDFVIETANDGNVALMRLRRYGTSISVVLLDIVLPGMDGFEVLEKMRASVELRTIPVVVVSSLEERETSLKAIRSGASDYVTKPIDPALLRLRVQSAISKAENERLRIQNNFLSVQSHEVKKYRTVLENEHVFLIEYNVDEDAFVYDKSISLYIDGKFDRRPLWSILKEDKVMSPADISTLQKRLNDFLDGKIDSTDALKLTMKSRDGQKKKYGLKLICEDTQPPFTTVILAFGDIDK